MAPGARGQMWGSEAGGRITQGPFFSQEKVSITQRNTKCVSMSHLRVSIYSLIGAAVRYNSYKLFLTCAKLRLKKICNRVALLIYYSRCYILRISQYTFLVRTIFS